MIICTVKAGTRAAAIFFLLTVGAFETRRTSAAVAPRRVLNTRPSVKARPISTSHSNDLTVLPVEPLRTRTGVVIDQVLCEENHMLS